MSDGGRPCPMEGMCGTSKTTTRKTWALQTDAGLSAGGAGHCSGSRGATMTTVWDRGSRNVLKARFRIPYVPARHICCLSVTGSTAGTGNSFCGAPAGKRTAETITATPVRAEDILCAALRRIMMRPYGGLCPTTTEESSISFMGRTDMR